MKDTSTDATILRHNSLLNPWKLGISIKKRKEEINVKLMNSLFESWLFGWNQTFISKVDEWIDLECLL